MKFLQPPETSYVGVPRGDLDHNEAGDQEGQKDVSEQVRRVDPRGRFKSGRLNHSDDGQLPDPRAIDAGDEHKERAHEDSFGLKHDFFF